MYSWRSVLSGLVTRPWTVHCNMLKCDSLCVHCHHARWNVVSTEQCQAVILGWLYFCCSLHWNAHIFRWSQLWFILIIDYISRKLSYVLLAGMSRISTRQHQSQLLYVSMSISSSGLSQLSLSSPHENPGAVLPLNASWSRQTVTVALACLPGPHTLAA